MDDKNDYYLLKTSEFEYTLVLGRDYLDEDGKDPKTREEGKHFSELPTEQEEEMDRLYYEYETLWLRSPTVLDKDDAYPRSYYWRLGGRYDPDKKAVLEEALSTGKRIEDTDAYRKYVEKAKSMKFTPDSWE